MPLEANVEPELDGKVMSAFIYEVRTQFLRELVHGEARQALPGTRPKVKGVLPRC
jgi:hypothetical protein